MFILVGMLVVGLIANLMIRPVNAKHFMTPEELAHEKKLAHEKASASEVGGNAYGSAVHSNPLWVVFAWTAVGIPLAWGIYRTLQSAGKFFN